MADHDWNARNKAVIEEFRANAGKVGDDETAMPVLILHTTGARSGLERVNPLNYLPDGTDVVVFASNGGYPTHPDWYHNLTAHPDVEVELGTERFGALARTATGEERERIRATLLAERPRFAEVEKQASRDIPVVVISRA
jgi:deazaflavin-dependent oxidoreductase (nitroreductase family)